MADIHVEKRQHSVWPWILGLIALALLLWALFEVMGDDRAEVAPLGAIPEPQLIEEGTVVTNDPILTNDPELMREGMVVTEEPILDDETVIIEEDEGLYER